jgi:alkanesulfonate monooxygenase SsuD/methylene tetrahydromethanopterin reductase-like flavin-dependent oxidoreductase (luciferase family)
MPKIDFAIFDHLDRAAVPLATLYEDRLVFAQEAERCGLAAYYVAEHHSTPLGSAPNPSVFLAALSQRTSTMRLGSMVHVLPAHEPLRLFEEICMLDHLSNGRLEIGVGRGASPYEIGLFGVASQEARDLFEESLAVIQQGLKHDVLSHRGHFHRYYDVPLTMRPLQPGGPPMWYGAFTERNLAFANTHGLNITLNGPAKRLRQMETLYREMWEEGRAADPSRAERPKVGCMHQVFVADTDEEAHRLAREAYASWYGNMIHLWNVNNAAPRSTLPATFDDAFKLGSFIAGSPRTVAGRLGDILDASGLTYVLLQAFMGTYTREQAVRSLRLFAEEVAPVLNGVPA